MSQIEKDYDPQYIRKELGTALAPDPDVVKVKAIAPGYLDDRNGSSHWVSIPAKVWRSMLDAVRGAGQTKALPQTFMGGEVIVAARIPRTKPHHVPHQAIIVREYEEQGGTLYSTHLILARHATAEWHADLSDYDIATREEAFEDFVQRMYRWGGLKKQEVQS